MTKTCRSCKVDKLVTEFSPEKRSTDGLKSYCKSCMSLKSKEYNRRNATARALYAKEYDLKHREKKLEYLRLSYQANKSARQEYGRAYRKIYLVKAKDKVATLARNAARRRRKTEPMFRVITNLRRRLNHLLKGSKSKKTLELTACDSEFLKKHLEAQFLEGMNWDNYGQWHVDHIIPLSRVNLLDAKELSQVCHYSNLQPMWAEDNIRKSNKITKIRSVG